MGDIYEKPDSPEMERLQRALAQEIEAGDYVVWHAWKSRNNERKERILTFGGLECTRTYITQPESL